MITKEQCRTLKIGDYLLVNNRWRQILETGQHPRGNLLYFWFEKLKGQGTTIATNYYLKDKVTAVIRTKSLKL